MSHVLFGCLCAALPLAAAAQDTSRVRLDVSAFIDVYYAHDFGRPAAKDRPFVTQAVRSGEFNVNLAHIAVAANHPDMRGRLVVQAGTAVQANYAGEPTLGANSGPSLARHLEEATLGVRLGSQVWLDAGIYLSYIGAEGWVSSTNLAYTRSYVAEFSPYYLSGARLTWTPSSKVTLQAHLVNGWQIISENNDAKAFGARVDYAPGSGVTLSYAAFVGNEQAAGAESRLRLFQQVMARGATGRFEWMAQLDYGRQEAALETVDWWGGVAIASLTMDPSTRFAARIERFADPDAVVVVPAAGRFEATGVSIGVDRKLSGGVLWRSELRQTWAGDSLFSRSGVPNRTTGNLAAVTSLAATF